MGSATVTSAKEKVAGRWALSTLRLRGRKRNSPLLALPRELRDQIFGYVLASPTGYILPSREATELRTVARIKQRLPERFRPPHPHRAASSYYFLFWSTKPSEFEPYSWGVPEDAELFPLTLLQTCKQIHAEAKPLFYALNVFLLPGDHLRLSGGLMRRPATWMRHVWIEIYLPPSVVSTEYSTELTDLESLLRGLQTWGADGALESVTLSLTPTHLRRAALNFSLATKNSKLLVRILRQDRLEWEAETRSLADFELSRASGLEPIDQFAIDPHGEGHGSGKSLRRILELSLPYSDGIPIQYKPVIEELRDAFGGELWLCDESARRLCWQDGVEKFSMFTNDI